MKKIFIPVFAVFILLLMVSCSKTSTNSSTSASTFIKVIQHTSSIVNVNTLLLSDGTYLVIGKDPANITPGLMVKMDANGNILWQKPLPATVTIMWKAISLGKNGYMATGYKAKSGDSAIQVIEFNNDGKILLSKTINIDFSCYKFPLDAIQLSNGNFAFAGSLDVQSGSFSFLLITDNAYNLLYGKSYSPENNSVLYAQTALCESGDGTINLTGYYLNSHNMDNLYLLKANPDAVQKFVSGMNDTVNYSSPGAIAVSNTGEIAVAGASANINAGYGVLVNYKNTATSYISGTINITLFDEAGNFMAKTSYTGYPKNGCINSIKSTTDGGFILCGTVNQQNAISVSNTEIFAMKVNAALNVQWTNEYNTQYPSYGTDILQTTDGGYLISGYQFSFSNNLNMVIIKTDGNGNVNQ